MQTSASLTSRTGAPLTKPNIKDTTLQINGGSASPSTTSTSSMNPNPEANAHDNDIDIENNNDIDIENNNDNANDNEDNLNESEDIESQDTDAIPTPPTLEVQKAFVERSSSSTSTPPFTPPLRISTSQHGDEVVITRASAAAAKKALARQEKRSNRQERKRLRKEEKSHRIYAKKLKNRNNMNIGRKVLHAGFGLTFAILNQVYKKEKFVPVMTVVTLGTLAMELLRYRKNFGWMNDILHFVLGGSLRKHEMEGKFTGSFYYFLGVTLTSALFPTSCASLGICQLALADPSASFFGRQTRHIYWSRIENGLFGIGRNKGVLGFLGGALFCFPFNFYVLSIADYGGAADVAATAAAVGTAVGTTSDAAGVVGTVMKVASTVLPGGRKSIAIASIALGLAGAFADLCVPSPALTMPKKICGVPMPPLHVDDNVVVPIVSGYACTKIFNYLGWSTGALELARFLVN